MYIKICGITRCEDADACVQLGVDGLGLNFVPSSPRRIDVAKARAIAEAVGGRAELVGVVADMDEARVRALRAEVGLDRVQLHGSEGPEEVRWLGSWAYKAVRVGSDADVREAERYEGLILIDAKVAGILGGTGHRVDPRWVAPLARSRPILLAGGLGPANVAEVIGAVRPWGVDTASGVECAPGMKDLDAVSAFVEAARKPI